MGPAIHSKVPLLKPEKIVIMAEGELVRFQIGNVVLHFHYEDGLKFSQQLRVQSKQAKRNAGDNSRHWSAVGIIESTS